jgi:hypothetical protein
MMTRRMQISWLCLLTTELAPLRGSTRSEARHTLRLRAGQGRCLCDGQSLPQRKLFVTWLQRDKQREYSGDNKRYASRS